MELHVESAVNRIRVPLAGIRSWLFFGPVAVTTLVGVGMMLDIVQANGLTPLEVIILGLFAVTFGWISIAFWNAVIGFALITLRRDPLSLECSATGPTARCPIVTRTALAMPVYNEDPVRTLNGLAVMLRSLARTGQGDRFDLFLLSDTTDSDIARGEEAAVQTLRQQFNNYEGIRYRRRPTNIGQKAGNIEEFCRRWGSCYDFMVVLDADSIMTGSTLVKLVRTMEDNPGAGLIQTVPIPARRGTLFGRLLQFAAQLYSPILATGQSFWQTNSANYWGHNAIIRVAAFKALCRLPVLPGRPPLGGAILSHDFVEAALLRRGGWSIYLLPGIGGSYEEVPGNIIDYTKRDRRWCQGSLQHLRLVLLPGWHWMSRLHFLHGAMGYVSSVFWLLMLLASTLYVVLPQINADSYLEASYPIWTDWSSSAEILGMSAREIVPLLGVTVGLLFLPKVLALILALGRERQSFGGGTRLVLSAILEMFLAVVVAPLMMMYHTRFVVSVLSGHNIQWEAQARVERTISWKDACVGTVGVVAVGVTWTSFTLYFSPGFFLWLTPIFAGMLLAAPLVRWTSSESLGESTRRWGLFLVPSETLSSPEFKTFSWRERSKPGPSLEIDVGAFPARRQPSGIERKPRAAFVDTLSSR